MISGDVDLFYLPFGQHLIRCMGQQMFTHFFWIQVITEYFVKDVFMDQLVSLCFCQVQV